MFQGLPLAANGVLFAVSAVVVWLAGTRLTAYADTIAEKTGIGSALLGLLLLATVTSLPELAVAVTASLAESPALSVNNVLGAASINVVILAVADAVYGRHALTSTPGSADVLLQGLLGMVLLALAAGATLAGDVLVLGIGGWSWLILATYGLSVWVISKSQVSRSWRPATSPTAADRVARHASGLERLTLRGLVLGVATTGAAICAAGFVLASSGDAIAEQTGLGAGFVGAVLLAAATELPELSTVLAAVRLQRYEMAIGDIFGTNLFNMTIIVLVDALSGGPPVLVEAGKFAGFGALLALVLTALIVLGLIERRDRTVLRMGFDSLAVIACYTAGVAILFRLR